MKKGVVLRPFSGYFPPIFQIFPKYSAKGAVYINKQTKNSIGAVEYE
jgi:hypothetical protein